MTTAWPIRRWLTLLAAIEVALLLAAVIGGGIAFRTLADARARLFDEIGPQRLAVFALSAALLNQQTGVRGYLLSRQETLLGPYREGMQAQAQAVASMRAAGAVPGTPAGDDLDALLRATSAWQEGAERALASGASAPTDAQVAQGNVRFDAVRGALDRLQTRLTAARDSARAEFDGAGDRLTTVLEVLVVLVVLLFLLLYFGLRRVMIRPMRRLAAEVRAVSDADIHRPVRGSGPRELVQLAGDVETMRRRIIDELTELERAQVALDARTIELERSNNDLEQFAYVASHDLQEPLRKVASFCQLLQRRYEGLLDERGQQYIEFAVDGAKRMQNLINDLLSFARVGKQAGEHVVVDADRLLDDALANLEVAISLSGAEITRGELPEVRGEPALLTVVFQNLVGNALKFRGDGKAQVWIDAERDGEVWVFSVADNGIGIEDEYAERIFTIFQRLHSRSAYPGTGIGLAMARKIVEYHGGRIWLDTASEGTIFRFTLPVLPTSVAEESA